ncbi:hypothetical protein AAC03nite_09550 [Alicyclobacillus acidoterrestris]|nr:hypothetical protein AAC03nite_09550 [Alicyclobacillus acidoterrestris]
MTNNLKQRLESELLECPAVHHIFQIVIKDIERACHVNGRKDEDCEELLLSKVYDELKKFSELDNYH